MTTSNAARAAGEQSAIGVLVTLSLCHCLNDIIQSLIPSIYPILKDDFYLSFTQIGLVTLTFQVTSSLLQPLIGHYADKKPRWYMLPVGMGSTLFGLLLFSVAPDFGAILIAAGLVGTGSAVFHPESSHMAHLASGGRHGMAQSLFQVGGNAGTALGPLLAAFIVLPYGQKSIGWFSVVAVVAIVLLFVVGRHMAPRSEAHARSVRTTATPALFGRRKVIAVLTILGAMVFSRGVYLAGMVSYYIFFLIERFHLSVRAAQIDLFIFLGAAAVGTVVGGPLSDRFGRKPVIWISVLGVLPFTLALPFVGHLTAIGLTVIIGFVMASAFPAVVVYAQDVVPGRVATVAGLFYGLAFGVAGLAAAALGALADAEGIIAVFRVCAVLPAIGLLAFFLPDLKGAAPTAMTVPDFADAAD
jgi:FSR family fosmidomycin resistance protein-like MFS transporter